MVKPNKDPNQVEEVFYYYFERVGNHEAAAVLTLVQYVDELTKALVFHVRQDKDKT